ncbi:MULTISPECIES: c-type cytochrome [Niastella]|uniref:Cytochrome c n=1 Tax=Niastella soli TaxID=2821487 RepID=A0ABS3YYD3_9BACT|nr:cytochrome c [Niastella soli]MBO9202940.1 cytochrome c [Niastella soli]
MNKLWIVCSCLIIWSCRSDDQARHVVVTTTGKIISIDSASWPSSFHLGRPASPAEIEKMDIDVRPDGVGLPAGEGKAIAGKVIYMTKCVACHGTDTTSPDAKLLGPVLVSTKPGKNKTIGNYWPYATTLFDYVRRAMPYNEPGSLTNEEVYQLTAFLLQANKVIGENEVMNAKTLPKVVMPAQNRFIPDDRRGGAEVR